MDVEFGLMVHKFPTSVTPSHHVGEPLILVVMRSLVIKPRLATPAQDDRLLALRQIRDIASFRMSDLAAGMFQRLS